MKSRIQICEQCHLTKPVNSKGLCQDCVFINNHNGLSRQEVYLQRSKERNIDKVNKPSIFKSKVVKTSKIQVKSNTLEKRREILLKDEETYEKVFNMKPSVCEECDCRLPDQFRDVEGNIIYRSQYSHILSKGAYPEFRHNPLNFNRLCFKCHHEYEFGDRLGMKINELNKNIIEKLFSSKNL